MIVMIVDEPWTQVLDSCVADLLSQQHMVHPIDAVQLAAGLGINVAFDASQAGRARLVRLGRAAGAVQQAVLLRPEPRAERIQWAVAHEIGEMLAHQVCGALGMDPREASPGERERLANQLATRLLLPAHWFAEDALQCDWDLVTLKQRYTTASYELIARRMLDFPPPAVISVFDQGRLSFRRAAPGRSAAAVMPLEWSCWREIHSAGSVAQRNNGPFRVRGWAVHEPGWKREILRLDGRSEIAELSATD